MDMAGQGAEALSGRLVAGYRLEQVLGTGLSGAVYLARREAAAGDNLPEGAAVKVLMPPWQATPAERDDFRERFLREAETLEQLRHPHIVPVLRHGQDAQSGLLYMIMPYIAGGTLGTALAQASSGMQHGAVAALLTQIADALDYAHAQGIIHRDVKPANVLLDTKGQAYLTDFSVARIVQDTRSTQTTTGKVLGTYHYMAPEQARGEHPTAASDQYSLGVLAYQLVTGQVPFDADSLVALALLHVQRDVTPPRILRPELPEAAEVAILRALAKQPGSRFADAASFARAFAAGLRGEWTEGLAPGQVYGNNTGQALAQAATVAAYTPPPTVMAPPARRRGRRTALTASALLSLLVLVGLLTLLAKGGLTAITGAQTANSPTATQGNGGTLGLPPTQSAIQSATTSATIPTATTMATATVTAAGGPASAPSATLQPASTTVLPTPTPLTVGNYQAAIPGHGCDTGGAKWENSGGASITCLSNAMQLDYTGSGGLLTEAFYGNGGQFSTNYGIGVTISNLGSRNCAGINYRTGNEVGYLAVVCGDASCHLYRYDVGGIVELSSASISASSTYQLDVTIVGSHHSISVNGTQVISLDDGNYQTTEGIGLSGYTYNSASVIADFSDFSFAPIS